MRQEHKYAQVLRWIADGEKVQHLYLHSTHPDWADFCLDSTACKKLILGELGDGWEFRLAPRTIRVNGVEVPAPERVAPKNETVYYAPTFDEGDFVGKYKWWNDLSDNNLLEAGLVYLTKEDAITRAKAMLLTQET